MIIVYLLFMKIKGDRKRHAKPKQVLSLNNVFG